MILILLIYIFCTALESISYIIREEEEISYTIDGVSTLKRMSFWVYHADHLDSPNTTKKWSPNNYGNQSLLWDQIILDIPYAVNERVEDPLPQSL